MAYDGWLTWDNTELVNLSRTAQLAQTMGINVLWFTPESVAWIEDALGGSDYDDIAEAPWYDPGFPASAEFAGLVPLSLAGLDDSTREAATQEYTTDGGNSDRPRNKTLPLPANFVVIASTDRGADFGKRWLDRRLSGGGSSAVCGGVNLEYFQFAQQAGEPVPPRAHRRDVTLTRATTVTRKRRNEDCNALWWVTFTLTANDPFEYGDQQPQFTSLGGSVTGPGVISSNTLSLVQESCPVWDYSPIFDPLYPALVAPPAVPDFYPAGWTIEEGDAFTRHWVRLAPVEPSALNLVPVFWLSAVTEARMVRLSVWPWDGEVDMQCDPLFSVVLTYVPTGVSVYIDGEQKASYAWDGVSPVVRRVDSLVYGPDATPLDWTAFNFPDGLLVTMDLFAGAVSSTVRANLDLVPKSD